MAQKVVSIYMTNDIIKVCEARKSGNSVTASNAFEMDMPDNCYNDGMVMDVDTLAGEIQSNMDMNGMKKGKLVFTISSRKIANKEIVIPFVKNQAKVEEIIQANLNEYFPMNNMDDYVCKHTILDIFENAEGKHFLVSVTAVQKDMIKQYFDLASAMGMQIDTIDYYGNSIYNILQKQLAAGVILALQMDRDATYVNIMKGHAQMFRRSIPFGRDMLVQNLANMNGISEQEALRILQDPQKLDAAVSVEQYAELVREFTESIMRVVEFHLSRNPGVVIELGKLIGDGAGIMGLPEMLSKELGIPVTYEKQLNGIKIKNTPTSDLNYEKISAYLPNIGAVMNSLNFKIESEKKSSSLGNYGVFYVLIAVASVGVIIASAIVIIKNAQLRQEKTALQAAIDEKASAELVYQDYESAKSAYDQLSASDLSTKSRSESFYYWMLLMEKIMPEGMGIDSITLEDGIVVFTLATNNKPAISHLISELKNVPWIDVVYMKATADSKTEEGEMSTVATMGVRLMEIDEVTAAALEAQTQTFSESNDGETPEETSEDTAEETGEEQ